MRSFIHDSIAFLVFAALFCFILLTIFYDRTNLASWYSNETCQRESKPPIDRCIMADGKYLDDSKLTAASWKYPFGTILEVVNIDNHKQVFVEVTDRGPGAAALKRGVILDLSRSAFSKIADLDKGLVRIRIIKQE